MRCSYLGYNCSWLWERDHAIWPRNCQHHCPEWYLKVYSVTGCLHFQSQPAYITRLSDQPSSGEVGTSIDQGTANCGRNHPGGGLYHTRCQHRWVREVGKVYKSVGGNCRSGWPRDHLMKIQLVSNGVKMWLQRMVWVACFSVPAN